MAAGGSWPDSWRESITDRVSERKKMEQDPFERLIAYCQNVQSQAQLEVCKLSDQKRTLECRLSQAKATNSKLLKEVLLLKKQLCEEYNRTLTLDGNFESLVSLHENLSADYEKLKVRNAELEEGLKSMSQEYGDLNKMFKSLGSKITSLQSEPSKEPPKEPQVRHSPQENSSQRSPLRDLFKRISIDQLNSISEMKK